MEAAEVRKARGEGEEAAAWAHFVAPANRAQQLQGWLAILCSQVHDARCGLLLLAADEAHSFVPGAVWPDGGPDTHAEARDETRMLLEPLGAVARKALAERRGVAQAHTPIEGAAVVSVVAYPLEVAGSLAGAIVVATRPKSEAALRQVMRQLHWASAWLSDDVMQQQLRERDASLARVTLANRLVATALQEEGLQATTLALANQMAQQFDCDRVAIGFDQHGRSVVQALSHSASFDARSTPLRLLAEAMDEALDLGRPLMHPAEGDAQLLVASHAALAREAGALAVWSVPLLHQGRPIGVISFERCRGSAPDAATLDTTQVLGELLGPILALKRSDERSAPARAADAARRGWRALFGPGSRGVKLVAASLTLVLLVLLLAQGEHRVTAKTVVEGAVQRAAVAPFDGFVAEGAVRAGDTVKKGQLLARLDDREWRVEQSRWAAEAEQALQKLRQAQAQGDRAAMNVLKAQAEQAQAQQALAEEKIARAGLVAPFDGVVVSGDLRQLIGSPVQQGKVLFEVAPLDAWRVTLQVDERDVARVAVEQGGELRLAGRPGEALPFTVAHVTPVAVAEDGRNFFRVEARLDAAAAVGLRPGMEGVGKVAVGRRSLLWIWFHPLIDWLRLLWWSWLP